MINAKNRLIIFLKFLKTGQNAFEEKVGIARGYISNNKGSIGSDILNKIFCAYPELNMEWLITGQGEMLKSHSKAINIDKTDDKIYLLIEQNTELLGQLKKVIEYITKK